MFIGDNVQSQLMEVELKEGSLMAVNARDEMKVNEIYLVFQCLTLKRQKPIAPLKFRKGKVPHLKI